MDRDLPYLKEVNIFIKNYAMVKFAFLMVIVLSYPVISSVFPFLNQMVLIGKEVCGQKMLSRDDIRFHFFPNKGTSDSHGRNLAGFGGKR